jgi:predicted RNA-binding Zn-ribbon protein involved in translation (DUF1610 family)
MKDAGSESQVLTACGRPAEHIRWLFRDGGRVVSKSAKIGVSVALIVAAVVIYVVRSRGAANDITSRTSFNAVVMCRACGARSDVTLDVTDVPPYKCPKCGKREAWGMVKCHHCGNVFLPEISGDPPRPPMIATCPKCKSQETGAAVPEP